MAMSLRRNFQDPATRRLLLAGFLTFVLLGALQAMYGPAFPALRARFGLTPEQVALLVSLHFIGSFVTITLSGLLLAALGYRRLLLGATATFAVGALSVALSPLWALTLAAALLLGLGYGALVLGVNLLFTRAFEAQSAPALNVLNAMFGVGAMLGPVLIGALLPRVGLPFLLVGGASLCLLVLFWRIADPPQLASDGDAPRRALPYLHVTGFVLLFFLYGATEVGTASWETTHLEPHFGVQRAAALTALFWLALTVGRFLAAPISARVPAPHLVLGAAALALVGVGLTFSVPSAPFAYALIGFALAPIFPTSIAWVQQAFPRRAEQVVPLAVAGGNLGPAFGAAFIGGVVTRGTPDSVPFALLLLAGPLLLVTLLLWGQARRGAGEKGGGGG